MDGFGHQEAKSCCSAIAREKMPNIERQLEGGMNWRNWRVGKKLVRGGRWCIHLLVICIITKTFILFASYLLSCKTQYNTTT